MNTDTMSEYKYTRYFEQEVLRKRPYLKREWCIDIVENSIRCEIQDDDRVRFWGRVSELDNKVNRVVTLADRRTINNAFPDRESKE